MVAVIIAVLRRPEVARRENFVINFCVFWKNDPCQTVATACWDRVQNLPRPVPTFGSHCSRSHPNRLLSAELLQNAWRPFVPHIIFTI